MKSKEALQDIRDYHNETVIDNYCTYTENMFEKQLDTIEKDLDILEILKKHYDVNFLEVSPNYFIAYSVYKDDEDFKKIKEWLDEKEKEERMEND